MASINPIRRWFAITLNPKRGQAAIDAEQRAIKAGAGIGMIRYARANDDELLASLQTLHAESRKLFYTAAGLFACFAMPLVYLVMRSIFKESILFSAAASLLVLLVMPLAGRFMGLLYRKPTLEDIWRERREAEVSNAFYSALVGRESKVVDTSGK